MYTSIVMLEHFSLIAPIGVALFATLDFILFIFLIVMLPGTILHILSSRLGLAKTGKDTRYKTTKILKSISGFLLYNGMMILIWLVGWPQYSNPVHSGYNLSGVLYLGLIMFFWTLTGMMVIYLWKLRQNSNTLFPGVGFFTRLYIWFITRQLMFYILNV
jgi:hypothetical protein